MTKLSDQASVEWVVIRLKQLGKLKGGAGFPDVEQGIKGEELPFFKVKHLTSAGENYILTHSDDSISRSTAARLGAFIFPPKTIVFAKVGAALLLNRFCVLGKSACIDNNMMGFVTNHHRVCSRFMLYRLSLIDFGMVANPGAVPSLNSDQVGDLAISIPSAGVQRKIINYLDRETARLDALIAAKERMLRLLAEKRRALITRAVTRGVNPDAELSNSGVPWLGQIPRHWETRKLAWLFRHRDERGEPELPLLEVSINSGVALREFSAERIESTAADFNTYKIAREGDIVFNKMRMWQGAVGVAPADGLVSPDYVVSAPTGGMSPDYARLLFRTEMFSAECARHSRGIVWDRLRLYWEDFRDIFVPLPPLGEQKQIIGWVDAESAKLDRVRLATERTISLLKERRAALIAAAVTGQLSIPELTEGAPSKEMACSSTT